ncbi:MAG: NmrA family NAD(P)-binding protein [Cryobacterium sp.]|nr:NmrA family NAD(P)-binding protein [Cryobacterium sp.]
MKTVLVTGATGTLGTPTARTVKDAGYRVRALSRKSGDGLTTGDLLTGEGIPEAIEDVDTVVHLATGSRDVEQAKAAIDACRDAGIAHFVLISIVGIESIPLGYYKGKVEIEKYLEKSRVPFSIVRATQFHQFVDGIFSAQRFLPLIVAPKFSFQPISTDDVATRLVELVGSAPAGRVADIGGPESLTATELAQKWKNSNGSRRAIWTANMPGKIVKGYAAGHNLVPGRPYGTSTFDEFLRDKYGK